MKKKIIFFAVIFFAIFFENVFSQNISLNGEKKKIMFSSNNGEFIGGLSTILFANLQTDSVGSRVKQGLIRTIYGMKFYWLEFHTDLELRAENTNGLMSGSKFNVKQLYLQFNPSNSSVSILLGRIRTSAAEITFYPYQYQKRATAKLYGVSDPFFGQYGNGIKLFANISQNISFAFDFIGTSNEIIDRPYESKTEGSAGLYVDIPSYYLKFSTGTQFCEKFRRAGTHVSWYNEKGGIFFLDGSFFIESPRDYESFFSYNGMVGVRLKNFEYHMGIENGPQTFGGKRTFLNNGILLNIEKGPSKYVLLADYQVPLGEERSKDWELNCSLLIFVDF
ncbi:MAG: hypothetical protein WC849_00515 [Candidatus Paceibacterota bacterium]